MRKFTPLVMVLLTLSGALAIYAVSFRYFVSEELEQAKGRLSVYKNTVAAELDRFSHLTQILTLDPFVQSTLQDQGSVELNERLKLFARQSGLDAIYLMDPSGLTIAASNADEPGSFVGQNYGFRPYFQEALSGQQGRFYAIGATTGLPGYFIADGVNDTSDAVTGVVAIKIDLSKLEDSWRNSGEQVFLVNQDGVIMLSSNPSWRYRTLVQLSAAQRADIVAARQFSGQELSVLDWQVLDSERVKLEGEDRLHFVSDDLPHGWTLHYFSSDERAVTRSWLVTLILVFVAAVALIILQIYRVRRVNAALHVSEQNQAELRRANELLATEVQDRLRAERHLKRTQDELERASRLAALGKLAASVTHELGQPITAMRNHLVAAEIADTSRAKLSSTIEDLVDRMEGITRQLKFFAGSDPDEFKVFDLRNAITASLELVRGNLEVTNTDLNYTPQNQPLLMRGVQLRLEQVITNLLRNAIDATDGLSEPQIAIRSGLDQDAVWLEIEDNGHGLGHAQLNDLAEPFFTTRDSGGGMGLGLAISADIVKDHDGHISAQNGASGGAKFRISFAPLPHEED